MKTNTRGTGNFGCDLITIKFQVLITRAYLFCFVTKRRIEIGKDRFGIMLRNRYRHKRKTGELPGMNMAEAADLLVTIEIAGTPGALGLRVRTEVDHAEGTCGAVEKKPARVGGIQPGPDQRLD